MWDKGSTSPNGGVDGDVSLLSDRLGELEFGCEINRSIENIRLPVGLNRLII